jgi:hypothetical protein
MVWSDLILSLVRLNGHLSQGAYLTTEILCSLLGEMVLSDPVVGQALRVLRIRIRDPVVFYPLDPGSGSGMNFSRIPDIFYYD